MKRIAIASGKGGTGKTTVTVNLAALLASQGQVPTLADLDVEEPNADLFLNVNWNEERQALLYTPKIDTERCTGPECGLCVKLCAFKAMILMAGEVMVFPELCHGCTLCQIACPEQAITEEGRELGTIRAGQGQGPDHGLPPITMVGGLMRVGEAMATPLIRAVKNDAIKRAQAQTSPLVLLDCPPGTACPVIAAVHGADYAVLVCEPTPFGLHDLKLAVALLKKMNVPLGVVINRHGMGDDRVERYLAENSIELLAAIPHSLEAAHQVSQGKLLVSAPGETRAAYETLANNLLGKLAALPAQEAAS